MIVQLRQLKPNSLRDFAVDPINEAAVARLMVSIREDGFWGGVVCRRVKDGIEIVAGHHRVEAARRCGIEKADAFVAETMDDDTALRVYARENATQRGMSDSTARAGSTAAAVRMTAYELLTRSLSINIDKPEADIAKSLGNLTSRRGIGENLLTQRLAAVPGLNNLTVRHDLRSLKTSGHYARIISEVCDRIGAERREAEQMAESARRSMELAAEVAEREAARLAAISRELEADAARQAEQEAQKAAEESAKEAVIFDYDGVSSCFRNPHQLEVFRDVVTRDPWLTCLPLDQQAAVARRIAAKASAEETQPDGYFIRTAFAELAAELVHGNDDLTPQQQKEVLQLTWEKRYREQQNMFLAGLRGAEKQGRRLLEHLEKQPEAAILTPPPRFWQELKQARQLIEFMEEYYGKTTVIEGHRTEGSQFALGEPRGEEREPAAGHELCAARA